MGKGLGAIVFKLAAGYIAFVVIYSLIDSDFEKDVAVMQSVVWASVRLLLVGLVLGLLIKIINIGNLKSGQKFFVLGMTLIIAVLPICLYWIFLVNVPSGCMEAAKCFLLLTGIFIGEILVQACNRASGKEEYRQ